MSRCRADKNIGLCNVTLDQLTHIHTTLNLPVHCVQNNHSVYNREAALPPSGKRTAKGNVKEPFRGVLLYCEMHNILFSPHGSLGGVRSRYAVGRSGGRDLTADFPELSEMAEKG